MMTDKKEAVFNGGPIQSYWWSDEHEPIHLAVKAELMDIINSAMLEKAWEETKKVYPIIDLIPDDYEREILFFRRQETSKPIKSQEIALFCGFSLFYFENTVILSAYHSLADEKGLLEIFKTLLNFYLSSSSDTEHVMMKKNRQPEEYFIQNTMLSPKGYTPQPIILYHNLREIFNDTEISNPENCAITVGELEISADSFDKLCEEYNSAPDELFVCAMAKAIYKLYPDERRKLSFGIMTDFRETFGVPETIAPCSKKMPLLLSYDDVTNDNIRNTVEKITETRAYQKSDDYIKSHVALENSYGLLNIRNACLSVNFSDAFDIGEKTSLIKNIVMRDYSLKSVFMIRLGNKINVSFQYGNATDKYMEAVSEILNAMGVNAKITVKAYPISAESETI